MKQFHKILFQALGVLFVCTSCEKELQAYSDPTCRLNFYYSSLSSTSEYKESMSRTDYSFIYAGESTMRDTVWLEVETMGFVHAEARPISLEQVEDTVYDLPEAVEGRHFVGLADASLIPYYNIPGGKSRAKVPIVLLRDASLKEGNVVLRLRIKENSYFSAGYDVLQEHAIIISDQLTKPTAWDETYCHYYFGTYGPVKHQFLIEESGERWDDDYINTLMSGDEGYISYLVRTMQNRLDELNAGRQAQGLGVLQEADGTEVVLEYTE